MSPIPSRRRFTAGSPARAAGAAVTFEPGEKHWHGASPTTAMTHTAIHEAFDGKAVDWMEHVSDEQYRELRSLGR